MADQQAVLKLLAGTEDAMSPDAICCALHGESASRTQRSQTLASIGKLGRRKFVERAIGGQFRATKAAREFIARGRKIEPGTDAAKWMRPQDGTLRAKVWRLLRQSRVSGNKFTLAEIAEHVSGKSDDSVKVIANSRAYLKGLRRAGIVTTMKQRAPGNAPTSRGFVRFALVRDLGVETPIITTTGEGGVFDPNSRTTVPFAKKEKRP
jgi:hypothetical protein